MLYLFGGMGAFLTWAAFNTKRATIGVLAAFSWFAFCVVGFQNTVLLWDSYFLVGFVGAGASLGMFIESSFLKFGVEGKNVVPEMPKEENHNGESQIDKDRRENGMRSTAENQRIRESSRLSRVFHAKG